MVSKIDLHNKVIETEEICDGVLNIADRDPINDSNHSIASSEVGSKHFTLNETHASKDNREILHDDENNDQTLLFNENDKSAHSLNIDTRLDDSVELVSFFHSIHLHLILKMQSD